MRTMTNAELAANYMAAVAHLLSGTPGRHAEFSDKVELILSGAEPDALQLMQFTSGARSSGRPVLWIQHTEATPILPHIGLVAHVDGRTHVIENCELSLGNRSGRARLIPDSFEMGAFRFDDELRLRHTRRAPAKNLARTERNAARAYARLRVIERDQADRGDVFALPEHAELRKAA